MITQEILIKIIFLQLKLCLKIFKKFIGKIYYKTIYGKKQNGCCKMGH